MVGPSSADSANSHHGCFSRVQKAKGIAEAEREQTAIRTLNTATDILNVFVNALNFLLFQAVHALNLAVSTLNFLNWRFNFF